MDVVYILGHQDDYTELRYSLRSLAFLQHDQVWIVGAPPPDWSKNLNHLPVEQKTGYLEKMWNQRNNIYQACRYGFISDDFVLMNDDFILLQSVGELPVIHHGEIDMPFMDTHPGGYQETWRWLKEQGVETPLHFAEHRPMVMNQHLMADFHDRARHIDQYPVPTLYGNLAALEGEQGEDALFDGIWRKGEWQVATYEGTFDEPYGDLIRYMFPDPSPYERR